MRLHSIVPATLFSLASFSASAVPSPVAGPLLDAASPLEPGRRLTARLTVPASASGVWRVTYRLQLDSSIASVHLPDPDYGADRALGRPSWTECEGKVIERGSLTDDKDYTEASTEWGSHTEAFQYVDLAKVCRISRITYGAGDANHAWKLDVSASADGKTYAPVADLQNVDIYQKWGNVVLPLRAPVSARFLRLRYHNGGEKMPVFRMPTRLSVYDAPADADFALPQVGPVMGQGTALVRVSSAPVEKTLAFPKPLPSGLYLLSARLENGSRRVLLCQRVLVLPAPLKSVSPASRFGVNASRPEYAPLLRRLGVGWVRFENMKWPFVSSEPGVYHFDGTIKPWVVNTDVIFKGYTQEGMSVLPFLFETALYATTAPSDVKEDRRFFYPPDNQAFADFCFQVAARYGAKAQPAADLKSTDGRTGLGYLHTYELWNEPNLTDPGWGPWVGTMPQYLETFRAGAEAVKRADPAARITNGGWAGIQVKTSDVLRTYTYADGKHPLDFMDVLNVHFYSGRVPPELSTDDQNAGQSGDIRAEDEFQRLAAWRDRSKPGMPIWLTETGYDSAGPFGTDERTQAARLPRVIMLALANGMDKVFVYRESGSTASMHAAAGVLRDDGTMKPSFLSYATLIRELDGVQGRATKLPAADPNVRLYLWRKDGKPILTAWTIEGAGKLNLNLGKATVTDAFGYRAVRDLSKGIALSAAPLYIRDVSDPRALNALVERGRQEAARREQRRQRLAKATAYLYKFGAPVDGVTLSVGIERPYTTVLAADVFTDARGFGFSPGPALGSEDRKWIPAEIDRATCRVGPGQEFRFQVKPGRYHLRFGVNPFAASKITLKGASGGDKAFPAAQGDSLVETDIDTVGGVLSVSADTYASLRWLTLVERLPGD